VGARPARKAHPGKWGGRDVGADLKLDLPLAGPPSELANRPKSPLASMRAVNSVSQFNPLIYV
jgi:hypothetical protein